MSLQDWLRNGWLVEHKISPAEIAGFEEAIRVTVARADQGQDVSKVRIVQE
jgi:hypothetical protein